LAAARPSGSFTGEAAGPFVHLRFKRCGKDRKQDKPGRQEGDPQRHDAS
jgi:hypothetical protein